MHLHHDLAAGRKGDAGPVGEVVAAPARRPGRDPVRVVQRVRDPGTVPGGESRAAEARPAGPRALRVEALRVRHVVDADPEEDHVVDDLRLARLDAGRRHERVGCPMRVDEEAAVVVGDTLRRRRLVRGLHPEVQERLAGAHLGALRRCGPSRRAVGPAARTRPREDRRALLCAQDPRVLAHVGRRARARRPGRHEPLGDSVFDRARLQPDLRGGLEREGCDAPDAVTAGALVRDDGRDVAREARAALAAGPPRVIASAAIGTASGERSGDRDGDLGCCYACACHMYPIARAGRHRSRPPCSAREAPRGARAGGSRPSRRRGPPRRGRRAPRPSRARRARGPSARAAAARSRGRAGGARRARRPSSVNALTPTTTRSPASTSRLVAER